MQHYIVQMGSGKPAELGTHQTEFQVFEKLGLKNPQIVFAPFHHLDQNNPENDWELFRAIYTHLTQKPIRLLEFHKEPSIKGLQKILETADLLVLGSGVCEPYLGFLRKNNLDRFIIKLFRQKHISLMGYSAGTISLSHAYIHNLFYEEVFHYWKMAQHSGTPREELDEMFNSMLQDAKPEDRETLRRVLMADAFDKIPHQFSGKVFQSQKMPALGLIPEQVILPHYSQSPYATAKHLQASARQFPWLKHYGLPNGVAFFHTFEDGGHLSTHVIGKNHDPAIKVTRHFPNRMQTHEENERIG
jgi:hypothetical protein